MKTILLILPCQIRLVKIPTKYYLGVLSYPRNDGIQFMKIKVLAFIYYNDRIVKCQPP